MPRPSGIRSSSSMPWSTVISWVCSRTPFPATRNRCSGVAAYAPPTRADNLARPGDQGLVVGSAYKRGSKMEPVPRSSGPRLSDGRVLPQQHQDAVRQGVEPEMGFVEQLRGIGVGVGEGRHFEVAAVPFLPLGAFLNCPVHSNRNTKGTRARDRAFEGGAESVSPPLPVQLAERRAQSCEPVRRRIHGPGELCRGGPIIAPTTTPTISQSSVSLSITIGRCSGLLLHGFSSTRSSAGR